MRGERCGAGAVDTERMSAGRADEVAETSESLSDLRSEALVTRVARLRREAGRRWGQTGGQAEKEDEELPPLSCDVRNGEEV